MNTVKLLKPSSISSKTTKKSPQAKKKKKNAPKLHETGYGADGLVIKLAAEGRDPSLVVGSTASDLRHVEHIKPGFQLAVAVETAKRLIVYKTIGYSSTSWTYSFCSPGNTIIAQ